MICFVVKSFPSLSLILSDLETARTDLPPTPLAARVTTVRFKDVTIEDLTLRSADEDASYTGPESRRDQLPHFFYSEGITRRGI